MCYNGRVYKSLHIVTEENEYTVTSRNHSIKVQEALNKIAEAEIYSIQHSASRSVSKSDYRETDKSLFSTLIVYREYQD